MIVRFGPHQARGRGMTLEASWLALRWAADPLRPVLSMAELAQKFERKPRSAAGAASKHGAEHEC
jgi:hypothetical protein